MRVFLWVAVAVLCVQPNLRAEGEHDGGSGNAAACENALYYVGLAVPRRRVVVTGIGIIAPTGNTREEAWSGAVEGRSGVGLITQFDPANLPVHIAGEVKNFDPAVAGLTGKDVKVMDRFIQMALVASKEAQEHSGLDLSTIDPTRVGTAIGVGVGGYHVVQEQAARALNDQKTSPFAIPASLPNMAAGWISMKHGLQGPNLSDCTACAASSHAVGRAARLIERGDADIMFAGGSEAAITKLGISGFAYMRALSKNNENPTEASRPWDVDRNGFVMGEGSAVLILESYESAAKRGAPILAEYKGWGSTGDASHMTTPGNRGAERAMIAALKDAQLTPEKIDHVNAHGTSTPAGDTVEAEAIAAALGPWAPNVRVSSTKSTTGHLLGGTGALEAAFSVLAIRDGVAPPTINLREVDPAIVPLNLNLTPGTAQEGPIRNVISNSFGFGGTNSSLIFGAPPAKSE